MSLLVAVPGNMKGIIMANSLLFFSEGRIQAGICVVGGNPWGKD